MTTPVFWKLGLIGRPISHSRSPAIHEQALRACQMAGQYLLYEAADDDVESVLTDLRAGQLHGLNVTIPYKESLLASCDVLDPMAELAGAVNTLVMRGGGIVGYNTDVTGLERALRVRWPARPWSGRRCTIYGAGGAARAACIALKQLGASEILIANRTPQRAEALAETMCKRLKLPIRAATEFDAFKDSALVIQATSLGVNDVEKTSVVARSKALMALTASDSVLMDLVYAPILPPFAVGAQLAGREVEGGLSMLVHQAHHAFMLWTGQSPPIADLQEAALVPSNEGC